MSAMRMGCFCALAGCLTAVAEAQVGTYGAPDPIPLGQPYAPQYAPAPTGQYPQYAQAAAAPYSLQYAAAPAVQYVPQYVPQYPATPAVQYAPQYAPQYSPQSAPQYAPLRTVQYVPQYAPAGTSTYARPYYSAPLVASRSAYATTDDTPGPTLAPGNAVPPPPAALIPPPAGIPVPQPASESSAVSNLLNEPNAMSAPPTVPSVMPPGGYIKEPGNCEGCGAGGCGSGLGFGCGHGCGSGCGCGGCGDCCSHWFFALDALYMGRNKPRDVYTSAEANNFDRQGIFNEFDWTPGAQAVLGYRFGCCCEWAVLATYWGLAEGSSDGGPGIPGPYVSPFTFGLTDILGTTGGGGTNGYQTANNYTDNSPNHHTWRNYQAQDVEVSLSRNLCGGECNCFGVDFLGGFRWFRFQDGLIWNSQRANDGSAYANDSLYLNDHVTNDLLGGQIGFNASYRVCNCVRVFLTPMVGLYDNHTTLDYNVYTVSSITRQQYQASSQTYSNPNYPIHATNDGFAVLTQVDLGLDWQITPHFGTQIGYRLVAATGIATPDDQIPAYGNDTQAIANIQQDGSLILHGAFAGLTINW
jgi:hypothetical protein